MQTFFFSSILFPWNTTSGKPQHSVLPSEWNQGPFWSRYKLHKNKHVFSLQPWFTVCSRYIVWESLFSRVVSDNYCVIGQKSVVGVVNAEKRGVLLHFLSFSWSMKLSEPAPQLSSCSFPVLFWYPTNLSCLFMLTSCSCVFPPLWLLAPPLTQCFTCVFSPLYSLSFLCPVSESCSLVSSRPDFVLVKSLCSVWPPFC